MTVRPGLGRRPMATLVCLLGLATLGAPAEERSAVEARLRHDVTFLASAECEGRGIHTKGIDRAADFIAGEFKKAGLRPAVANPGYFQPFTVAGKAKLGGPHSLALRGPLGQDIELKMDADFRPVGLSSKGAVAAPLVFVGYGVTASNLKYDDYQGVDVAGKIVIMLRKTPRPENAHVPFDGAQAAFHAGLETKLVKADLNKAAAVFFVNDYETARNADPLMEFAYTASSGSPAKVPVLHVRRSVVETLVQSATGRTLRDVELEIDRTLRPQSSLLTGWEARLDVRVDRTETPVKNVIAVLDGAGRLANETVVVGAHYDHLGFGGDRNSLAADKSPKIHHGADDNASGTTALLELARRFASAPPTGDRRRVVFMAFSAEEIGLIGSAHYCKKPLFPLDSTTAMLNLDMVGRLRPNPATNRDRVYVEGSGTAKHFDGLLDQLAKKHDVEMSKSATGYGPSDHASFYTQKIPVIFYWTGNHADYHKPSDTADKINVAGLSKIVGLSEDTLRHLATEPQRPEYVYLAPKSMGGMRTNAPRLGIVPNYAEDAEGVLLDGVTEKGPAAKAGLKAGDRIIAIGAKPVRNVNSYMVLMSGFKKGQTIEVTYVRGKEKATAKVLLE